jgi:malate/lactate dehydrogenase
MECRRQSRLILHQKFHTRFYRLQEEVSTGVNQECVEDVDVVVCSAKVAQKAHSEPLQLFQGKFVPVGGHR